MALIPGEDVAFLNEKGFDYTLAQAGSEVHLTIRRFSFPRYTPDEAELLAVLPAGYPQTAMDMFYTIPDVKLPSGAFPQSSDCRVVLGNRTWQRWSRHMTWRSGIDSLRTFLVAVVAEINKGI